MTAGASSRRPAVTAAIFVWFLCVLLLSWGGWRHVFDAECMARVTDAALFRGSFLIEIPGLKGWHPCKFGPGQSALFAPFALAGRRIAEQRGTDPIALERRAMSLLNPIVIAAIGTVLFRAGRALGLAAPRAWLLSILGIFGTPFWSMSQYGNAEPATALFLLFAVLILCYRRTAAWSVLAGGMAGLAFLTKPNELPLAILLGAGLVVLGSGRTGGGQAPALRTEAGTGGGQAPALRTEELEPAGDKPPPYARRLEPAGDSPRPTHGGWNRRGTSPRPTHGGWNRRGTSPPYARRLEPAGDKPRPTHGGWNRRGTSPRPTHGGWNRRGKPPPYARRLEPAGDKPPPCTEAGTGGGQAPALRTEAGTGGGQAPSCARRLEPAGDKPPPYARRLEPAGDKPPSCARRLEPAGEKPPPCASSDTSPGSRLPRRCTSGTTSSATGGSSRRAIRVPTASLRPSASTRRSRSGFPASCSVPRRAF
ncbi:MAG: hypothetical protein U0166_28985 [Acidobacteriota bacterium]